MELTPKIYKDEELQERKKDGRTDGKPGERQIPPSTSKDVCWEATALTNTHTTF